MPVKTSMKGNRESMVGLMKRKSSAQIEKDSTKLALENQMKDLSDETDKKYDEEVTKIT